VTRGGSRQAAGTSDARRSDRSSAPPPSRLSKDIRRVLFGTSAPGLPATLTCPVWSVLVLLVTVALSDQLPSVVFEQPDELAELHAAHRAETLGRH